jgi:N-acetylmuramoyl-L-alanine amidase
MKPVLECGHGGMINGVYQCVAVGKQYTFEDGFTVYEGVVNRQIARRLAHKLTAASIPHIDFNSCDETDMPLRDRTAKINDLYKKDKSLWLLSIHSNAFGDGIKGSSHSPNGCETFIHTLAGKRSEYIQSVAERHYKANGHKWRGSKTANFWMLKDTHCPALLVENYFFTNRADAEFLVSDVGQEKIANTLFAIIKELA